MTGVTHGRHCPCSACEREDWGNPDLAHCGTHGAMCPPVYAPITAAPAPGLPLDDYTIESLLRELVEVGRMRADPKTSVRRFAAQAEPAPGDEAER